MAQRSYSVVTRLQRGVAHVLTSSSALAFLPALSLAAFWFGGEATLIVVSALLPIIFLLCGIVPSFLMVPRDAVSGLFQRSTFEELTEQIYLRTSEKGRQSATFFIAIPELRQNPKFFMSYDAEVV